MVTRIVSLTGTITALRISLRPIGISLKSISTSVSALTSSLPLTASWAILSHPVRKDWIGKKNLYDFNSEEIDRTAGEIKNGTGGYIEIRDPTTGKNVVMFYEPVKTGNLAFVLVIPKEEMLAGVVDLRNRRHCHLPHGR